MANTTINDGNYTRSTGSVDDLGLYVFLAALNIFLSITALLGNALILIALHKVTSIYPPTKLLFRCLAVTDICVGFILQPLFVISLLLEIPRIDLDINWGVVVSMLDASTVVLAAVSILTSTAISVDRLLALIMGLRYRHVSCNIKTSTSARNLCLDFKLPINSRDTVWGRQKSAHYFKCGLCFDSTVYPDLNHLLHKNLSPTPPSSNSVTRQPTTTRTTAKRRRNSTEYSAIQEDGFQHSMGTVGITYLLSSLFCFTYFNV